MLGCWIQEMKGMGLCFRFLLCLPEDCRVRGLRMRDADRYWVIYREVATNSRRCVQLLRTALRLYQYCARRRSRARRVPSTLRYASTFCSCDSASTVAGEGFSGIIDFAAESALMTWPWICETRYWGSRIPTCHLISTTPHTHHSPHPPALLFPSPSLPPEKT